MKVKARSVVRGTFIGTIIWVAAVAVLNVVLFLVFGRCKPIISIIAISIIGLGFKVGNFLYIAFLALIDRDVDLVDGKESEDKAV